MKEDKPVLPTLTPEDAKTTYAAGTDYGFRLLDYVDYTDYKQEDRSGTHRKSALQLDVEALKQRVVELERRLSEMDSGKAPGDVQIPF